MNDEPMPALRSWLRRTITYAWARRIVVGLIGGTVLLIGLAMLVLPGPGLLVVPLGLAILGLEFAWARAWLRKVKAKATEIGNSVRGKGGGGPPPR